jgi:hypothetical protein
MEARWALALALFLLCLVSVGVYRRGDGSVEVLPLAGALLAWGALVALGRSWTGRAALARP